MQRTRTIDQIAEKLIDNLDSSLIDPLTHFPLKNMLLKKRQEALMLKDNSRLSKIDDAIIYLASFMHIYNFSRWKINHKVDLKENERKKLHEIVESLMKNAEIESIKPQAIPKLQMVLNERHLLEFKKKCIPNIDRLLKHIQKLEKFDPNPHVVDQEITKTPKPLKGSSSHIPIPKRRAGSVTRMVTKEEINNHSVLAPSPSSPNTTTLIPYSNDDFLQTQSFLELERAASLDFTDLDLYNLALHNQGINENHRKILVLEYVFSFCIKEQYNNDSSIDHRISSLENTVRELQSVILDLQTELLQKNNKC